MLPVTVPLTALLRRVPAWIHEGLFSAFFNHMMQGQSLSEQLSELTGKVVCLRILDAHRDLLFLVREGGIARAPVGAEHDALIAGNLEDFWALATRSEDPDTLFFQRRLMLEGETETGLYIKNMLDALEFDWRTHLNRVMGERAARPLIRLVEQAGIERHLEARFPLFRGY